MFSSIREDTCSQEEVLLNTGCGQREGQAVAMIREREVQTRQPQRTGTDYRNIAIQ